MWRSTCGRSCRSPRPAPRRARCDRRCHRCRRRSTGSARVYHGISDGLVVLVSTPTTGHARSGEAGGQAVLEGRLHRRGRSGRAARRADDDDAAEPALRLKRPVVGRQSGVATLPSSRPPVTSWTPTRTPNGRTSAGSAAIGRVTARDRRPPATAGRLGGSRTTATRTIWPPVDSSALRTRALSWSDGDPRKIRPIRRPARLAADELRVGRALELVAQGQLRLQLRCPVAGAGEVRPERVDDAASRRSRRGSRRRSPRPAASRRPARSARPRARGRGSGSRNTCGPAGSWRGRHWPIPRSSWIFSQSNSATSWRPGVASTIASSVSRPAASTTSSGATPGCGR